VAVALAVPIAFLLFGERLGTNCCAVIKQSRYPNKKKI
jgi:hypothetical protein